jgi:hypothetical protein
MKLWFVALICALVRNLGRPDTKKQAQAPENTGRLLEVQHSQRHRLLAIAVPLPAVAPDPREGHQRSGLGPCEAW